MKAEVVVGAVILLVIAIAAATEPVRRRRRARKDRIARARQALEKDFIALGAATSALSQTYPSFADTSRRLAEASLAIRSAPAGISTGRSIYRGLSLKSGFDDRAMADAAAAFRELAGNPGQRDSRALLELSRLFAQTAADIRRLGAACRV